MFFILLCTFCGQLPFYTSIVSFLPFSSPFNLTVSFPIFTLCSPSLFQYFFISFFHFFLFYMHLSFSYSLLAFCRCSLSFWQTPFIALLLLPVSWLSLFFSPSPHTLVSLPSLLSLSPFLYSLILLSFTFLEQNFFSYSREHFPILLFDFKFLIFSSCISHPFPTLGYQYHPSLRLPFPFSPLLPLSISPLSCL